MTSQYPGLRPLSVRAKLGFGGLIVLGDLMSSVFAVLPLMYLVQLIASALGMLPPLITLDPMSTGIKVAISFMFMAGLAMVPAVVINALLARRAKWKHWQAMAVAAALVVIPVLVLLVEPQMQGHTLYSLTT